MSPSQVHPHAHSHDHANLNALTLQDQLLYATKRQVPLSRNNSHSNTTSSTQPPTTLLSTSTEVEIQEHDTFKLVLWTALASFLIYHVPLLVFGTIAGMYLLTWFVYSTWGFRKLTLSTLPLDPWRVIKLNRIMFFINIPTNISLIPLGLYLARWRLWTMRGSKGLVTDVPYNAKRPGKTLDIYIPDALNRNVDQNQATSTTTSMANDNDKNPLLPVIVFIYGGSWCSGSKKTYTLIGARFRALGYIVIIPEYTTFPVGLVRDMQDDIRMALQWTQQNCRRYGGDSNRIYLMGHSAGAHLCALTVMHDSVKKAAASLKELESATAQSSLLQVLLDQTSTRGQLSAFAQDNDENNHEGHDISLPQLKGLILCSGVYEIGAHLEHEKIRGVEEVSAMSRVMGDSPLTFGLNSPTTIIQEVLKESSGGNSLHHRTREHLPANILVVHGEEDGTVPSRSSVRFHNALQSMHLDSGAVRLKVFPIMAHQAPVVGIMPSFKRESPFCQLLLDEYSAFIS